MAINDFNEIPDGFSFFLEEDGSAVTIPETPKRRSEQCSSSYANRDTRSKG